MSAFSSVEIERHSPPNGVLPQQKRSSGAPYICLGRASVSVRGAHGLRVRVGIDGHLGSSRPKQRFPSTSTPKVVPPMACRRLGRAQDWVIPQGPRGRQSGKATSIVSFQRCLFPSCWHARTGRTLTCGGSTQSFTPSRQLNSSFMLCSRLRSQTVWRCACKRYARCSELAEACGP
jgi:hypothetical protein